MGGRAARPSQPAGPRPGHAQRGGRAATRRCPPATRRATRTASTHFVADTYAAIAGEHLDGLPTFADGRGPRPGRGGGRSAPSAWVEVAATRGRPRHGPARREPGRPGRRPAPTSPCHGAAAVTADRALSGIGKSFFGVRCCSGVDLDLRAGRGARPGRRERRRQVDADEDPGRGAPRRRRHRRGRRRARSPSRTRCEAQRAGISTVFQEFNLLPERTVAENVFLGREPRRCGLVDGRRDGAPTPPRLLDDLGRRRSVARGPGSARLSVAAAAGGRDRQGALHRRPDHRRWTSRPRRSPTHEVELLYRLVRRLARARRRRPLRVAPAAEIFDLCRPHHGAQGRRASSRRSTPPTIDGRRAGPADGRAASSAASSRQRPARRRGDVRLQLRRRRQRDRSTASTSRCGPARSSALAGPAGQRAAPRSRRRFRRRAVHPRPGRGRRAAARLRTPRAGAARRARPRHRGPQGRGPRAAPVGAGQRPRSCSTRTFARSAAPPGSAACPTSCVRAAGLAAAASQRGAVPLRRQPAEGRARQVARRRAAVIVLDEPTRGIDVGAKRARSTSSCASWPRDGAADPDDLLRAARADRHGRPDRRAARRPHRRRAARRRAHRGGRDGAGHRPRRAGGDRVTATVPRRRRGARRAGTGRAPPARRPPASSTSRWSAVLVDRRRPGRARRRQPPVRRRTSSRCSRGIEPARASSPSGRRWRSCAGSLDLSVGYVSAWSSLVAADHDGRRHAPRGAGRRSPLGRRGRSSGWSTALDHHQAAGQRVHRHARHRSDHQGLPRHPLQGPGRRGARRRSSSSGTPGSARARLDRW